MFAYIIIPLGCFKRRASLTLAIAKPARCRAQTPLSLPFDMLRANGSFYLCFFFCALRGQENETQEKITYRCERSHLDSRVASINGVDVQKCKINLYCLKQLPQRLAQLIHPQAQPRVNRAKR